MPQRVVCLAVYLGYIALSSVIGEHFLFTRHSMYSKVFLEKPTIVFSAGGKPAELHDYTDFAIDASALDPARLGFNGNEYYFASEIRAYMQSHPAAANEGGLIPIQVDLYESRWDPSAKELRTTRTTLCRGAARSLS